MLQNFALTWVLIFALGMASTLGGPTTEPGRPRPSNTVPELRMAIAGEPDSFAPYWSTSVYDAAITERIYGDGLMRVGYDYRPEPALAEALPTISGDGLTYTFRLRKGIRFHDGTELTAADVAFSYSIILHPDYTGPYLNVAEEIDSVKALDSHTVEIRLRQPFAPFLLGGAELPIVAKHVMDGLPVASMVEPDLWQHPVGAGPYRFVEARRGQYILLERNPTYWETGKTGVKGGTVGPFFDRLRVLIIPEWTTQLAALEVGELSFVSSVTSPDVAQLKAERGDRLVAYEWNRMGYGQQTFNTEAWPTNIKEVRQALSYGLDRQAIVNKLFEGNATIPAGLIPPTHPAHDPNLKGYNYDPEKARALLESAGFRKNANGIYEKDGKPLKLKFVATKGSTLIEQVALISQQNWKALGVDLEIYLVDFYTLIDRHMKTGDFHVTFSGLGFSVDPHYSFHSSFHSGAIRLDSKGINQGSNRARYRNSRVDQLIDQAKVTQDQAARLQLYHEAQRLIVDDAPVNWLYVNRYTDFAQKGIEGIVNWDGYGIDTRLMNQWKPSAK